jgi:hypothetical protein
MANSLVFLSVKTTVLRNFAINHLCLPDEMHSAQLFHHILDCNLSSVTVTCTECNDASFG